MKVTVKCDGCGEILPVERSQYDEATDRDLCGPCFHGSHLADLREELNERKKEIAPTLERIRILEARIADLTEVAQSFDVWLYDLFGKVYASFSDVRSKTSKEAAKDVLSANWLFENGEVRVVSHGYTMPVLFSAQIRDSRVEDRLA